MNAHQPFQRHFASDNYAGICPEAWQAMAEANQGHALSYGDDPWTARAADLIRAVFADLPPWLILALRAAGRKFYTFIGQGGCRFMCARDTREEDVRAFISDLKRLLVEAPRDT